MTRIAPLAIALLGVACATTSQGEPGVVSAQVEAAMGPYALKADALMKGAFENERFNGVALVATCDEILYHKAYGEADSSWNVPLTEDTAFQVASITKQFTAALILQLVEEGKLALDGHITDYLPEYPGESGDIVTIRQLLSHTSGIPDIWRLPGAQGKLLLPMEPKELLTLFSEEPLTFTPGSDYAYSNAGYIILGVLVEEMTGMGYAEALRARIVEPLGLTNTGLDDGKTIIPTFAQGYEWDFDHYVRGQYIAPTTGYSAGMLYSTTKDIHTFNCGLHNGKLLKDPALVEEMITPVEQNPQYGLGQRLDVLKVGEVSYTQGGHSGDLPGIAAQDIFIPEAQLSVVVLANNTPGDAVERAEDLARIYFGEDVKPVTRSLRNDLSRTYVEGGVEAVETAYKAAMVAGTYHAEESDLNILGYQIMARGDMEGAIKVFILNTQTYPESSNLWDSLGEGYMNAGEIEKAILNYEKSVELNQDNTNGVQMIEKLKAMQSEAK